MNDSSELVLAAEEFSSDQFADAHEFSSFDNNVIRLLTLHGPVLLRAGRGVGKSALMVEAARRMRGSESAPIGVYVSLRYIPLLRARSSGYIEILEKRIADALVAEGALRNLPRIDEVAANVALSQVLARAAATWGKRIVLLLDDAAHIGREESLADFFDFFRTVSSEVVSCKASIYPGVTRFGSRFDIYNDATVVDLVRNEAAHDYGAFFLGVIDKRVPGLSDRFLAAKRDRLQVAAFLGRAVVGNVRAFLRACKWLLENSENRKSAGNDDKVTLNEISDCFKELAENHYFPLLEELEPKLGAYAQQVKTANALAITIFDVGGVARTPLLTIHREHDQRLRKSFEILEYCGFLVRREASRSLTGGGGRGPRFALSFPCLVEKVKGVRVDNDLFERLMNSSPEVGEIPAGHPALAAIPTPIFSEDPVSLDLLDLPIDRLAKSRIYPYGLTPEKLKILKEYGIKTIGALAALSESDLQQLPRHGPAYADRAMQVARDAIWM
jgi:hypothetical protein